MIQDPNIISGEGIESESEMQEETVHTEQGIYNNDANPQTDRP